MTGRELDNLIPAFGAVCQHRTPEIFRTWAGIVMISGVLERKCWAMTGGNIWTDRVYPTLGVFLVAPGGVGKSKAIDLVEKAWRSIPALRVSPKSLTAASFCDAIRKKARRDQNDQPYHPLLVASDELVSFFLGYDKEQLGYWSQAIDCVDVLSQQRRGLGTDEIGCTNPSLSFLLGGQPGAFNTYFPDAAYDQGFMGRAIIVFHERKHHGTPHPKANSLFRQIKADLALVADLEGQFTLQEGVLDLLAAEDLRNEEILENLAHPRLEAYYNRKHIHALKIAMALSAARESSLHIAKKDYTDALALLARTETEMVSAFVAPKQDEDALVIDETMRKLWAAGVSRVKKTHLNRMMYGKVSAARLPLLIETMKAAGMLSEGEMDYFVHPDFRKLKGAENVEEIATIAAKKSSSKGDSRTTVSPKDQKLS